MSTVLSTEADLDRFRILIESQLGLRFDRNAGQQQLVKVLNLRLAANRQACQPYFDYLAAGPKAELRALGEQLTVGETYFLRHIEQFRALTGQVLPDRLGASGRSGPLQVLSAACSTGEETYSLAIALHESGASRTTSILGIDVNPAALAKAQRGRYTTWSLRSVPESVQRQWFTIDGNDVEVDQRLRELVRFQQANLVDDDPVLWRPEAFDVVFCRNVLMYFAPEVMAQVVQRIARALVPGGYLFLGSAETLRGIPCDLQLRESHGTFYYQRQSARAQSRLSVVLPGALAVPELAVPELAVPQPNLTGAPDLELALSLLRQERFAEALAAIEDPAAIEGLAENTQRPDLLLLRAALLTHSGSYPAAVAAAMRLLEVDELSAGAHVLLATCRESEGDVQGAIGHCRAAISRDPRFAMAHVQLARLTQRIGDRERAGAEYAASARLLRSETDHRILLFGGGFDREALISLCRTQSTSVVSPPTGGRR